MLRPPQAPSSQTIVDARKGFVTKTVVRDRARDPIESPPSNLFKTVQYTSAVGQLAAYLTPDPRDGQKHPAIIWITGGDCNSIGDVWGDAPAKNDQTAGQYRKAGIVMMFPSLRGGNTNPGTKEGFFGEVDDVIAAADLLAKQPYVDPNRIYLGGHSTGGTLAMLVAASSDRFRAVFAFGPVDDVGGYPEQYLPFDTGNPKEIELRSPIVWLGGIKSPTFVIEGERGNADSLDEMKRTNTNAATRFLTVRGADHFSVLAPVNRLIAKKIIADTAQHPRLNSL
jgi:alpha/beta superfamily hydrolase